MSLQQSKTEKSDPAQLRKAGGGGRSSASGGAHPPKGVGGPTPHNASNTSGKRSNGPGGQSRGNPNAGSSQSNVNARVPNGGHSQRQQTGSASATVGNTALSTTKQSNVVALKSNGILPKPPIAQPSNTKALEQTSSMSTAALLGESTRATAQQPFAFQFGSFSPTLVNGFQIPARTSSAPPNFDEQKRDQARSGPPTDVSIFKTSTLSGTVQQLEGQAISNQITTTLESTAEGNKILQGSKASPTFVMSQEVSGGQIPSTLPIRSNNASSSQLPSQGAASGPRVTSSHQQSHGVAQVARPSSHLHSQGAPSGPHATNSQMHSQGVAAEPHAPSFKLQSQGGISGQHGPSSQLQPQGSTPVLHAPSSQLQPQVVTSGQYAPSSQLQSQGVAPGSRSLQVPLQMPQVQQQVFGSQGLGAGALHSQGMLHHGLGFQPPLRHSIPQQSHVLSQQFLPGNHPINAHIPIQVTGSGGTHLPSYVTAPQANQYVPQRTSTIKITHPETHEELKFGPKGVKSDSHVDSGITTLVSDSSPLPGGLPQYGTPHSGSVPVSGLHQIFYPSVSGGPYGHPQSFHQPTKMTAVVRPNTVRPLAGPNFPPVSHSGANLDALKQPPHTAEVGLATMKASEGKTMNFTMSLSQSSHVSSSPAVLAAASEVSGNLTVSKSDIGAKHSTVSTHAMATHNPSDSFLAISSAVTASGAGANYHASEEQKIESIKPIGVSTREHPKKALKSEIKNRKHHQLQASLPRSSSNAQAEFKGEAVAESSEVCGSCADASKSGLNQGKHKKQQQQQEAPLLQSSSNAQIDLKEVATESLEMDSCTEADKFAVSHSLLSTSMSPLVNSPQKTMKSVDGGATPELARKALETVLHPPCPEPSSIAFPSNSATILVKADEISTSKSSSGKLSNNTQLSSLGITGDLGPAGKMSNKDSSAGAKESAQNSEARDEFVVGDVTTHLDSLDQTGGEKTEMPGLVNKSVAKEDGWPAKIGDGTVCNDTLARSRNLTCREPLSASDSTIRDVTCLESASISDMVSFSNSVQCVNSDNEDTEIRPHKILQSKCEMDIISDPVLPSVNSSTVNNNINEQPDDCSDSVIGNEKVRLLEEEVKFNKMRHGGMASHQAELDNGTVVDDENLVKDRKTEELVATMQSTYSDEAPQLEPRSEVLTVFPVADVAIMEGQSGLPSVDTCKGSHHDISFGQAEGPTANVKNLDTQDKVEVPLPDSNNHEATATSPQVPSLPVDDEVKLDLLGRVTENEAKISTNVLSNNKISNIGDVPKTVGNKKKKKLKDCLSKADAAAHTGDLYIAYKVPEKAEDVNSVESSKVGCTVVEEKPSLKETQEHVPKEVDDWEDAAEISTNIEQVVSTISNSNSSGGRKYSRDFLMTFKERFHDLPLQFDCQDLLDNTMICQAIASRHGDGEPLASMGRVTDYSRFDRRGSNVAGMDEDKWTKPMMDAFAGGRDMRMDMGFSGPSGGFRPGQSYNTGFGKNMRGAVPNIPGNLPSGQFVQAPFTQGGPMRINNSDVDRWHRPSGLQKGLIPPPVIHKTDNRYEVGKVSDEEELKQRQIKSILNKLTPQNFEKLFLKVKEVNIDSAVCLKGVISQIFDKALTEPTFCEMYAKFCVQLAAGLPQFYEDNEKVMFRRVLLNKCQEEFQRDEREQAEAESEDGEIKLSKEEREIKRSTQRRRMLGNIRFIGELYKESMLTERIMHECIKKLLGEYQKPDEENVESLCKLMSTIGHIIDHPKAKEHIDAYFNRITQMAGNQALPSRLRFMLKDVIDLRRNEWQQRRKVDGPKKIEEVHRDAAQERQQASRLNRIPSMGHPGRRISTPPDHGSRGSQMPPFMAGAPISSSAHMSGMRGVQAQTGMRGVIAQDARVSDRNYDRAMPMPLQYRPSDEGQLTLGPQGGLARGITGRGQTMRSNRNSLADGPIVTSGSNRRANLAPLSAGYNSNLGAERMSIGTREEIPLRTHGGGGEKSLFPRSGYPERAALGNERREFRNLYSSFEKGGRSAALEHQQEYSHGLSSGQFSEEQLTKKSDMAIREYYSVRDLEEAALCVSDLKSPWYHPTLVLLWIMDSFDRKDVERSLLGDLLIYLYRTEPFLLNREHLIKGLEKVIALLEDAVVDAPRAPEFLGKILGKLVDAGLLPVNDIVALLEEGGTEPSYLLEICSRFPGYPS